MKILIFYKWNLILLLLLVSFLNACNFNHCEMRDTGIGGLNENFNERRWKEFNIDNATVQFVLDYPEKYYAVLINREKMVCDLTQRILKEGDDFYNVKNLLGNGSSINAFPPSNLKKLKSLNIKLLDNIIGDTKEALKNKNLLLYIVGYNASGDCYLGLVFKDKKYKGCFRIFAI